MKVDVHYQPKDFEVKLECPTHGWYTISAVLFALTAGTGAPTCELCLQDVLDAMFPPTVKWDELRDSIHDYNSSVLDGMSPMQGAE